MVFTRSFTGFFIGMRIIAAVGEALFGTWGELHTQLMNHE